MRRLALLALCLFALLGGCPTDPGGEPPTPDPNAEPDWPELQAGALSAGASGGYLDIPVGVPLTGYTGRDNAFGGEPGPDSRDSDYTTDFQASGGWQTAMPVQVVWLTDGTRHSVLVRLDLIYSWDEMTEEIGRRLSDATGIDLTDSVFTFTNHSHSSPGTFTNATVFFLGSDMFSAEIYGRMVDTAVDHALSAFEDLTPAKAGLGVDLDFDPIGVDRVFRDRREENSDLLGPGGIVTGPGWKDQRATMLRVDSLDDEPIAALFAFGIHGTIMGGSNTLMSTEAGGHIATLLQERHGGPQWVFAQGAGGDASPAGQHGEFARMEWLAEEAVDSVLNLYDSIELSSDPMVLEPLQRYVPQDRESVRVTRNGTEILEYEPWDPSWAEWPPFADEQIYNDEGRVATPIDEFWAQYGAALCGDPTFTLPTLGLDVELHQYKSCIRMEKGFIIFAIAFQEYFENEETDFPLPLPSTASAMLGALGMRSIPVTTLSDTEATVTESKDVVFAFAPGEPTTLWTQFLRYRAREEWGVDEVVVIGYAMDHEGYLLTTEDWLLAGYEASITFWGPLQGEAMLERFLELIALGETSVGEDPDWPDWPGETVYLDRTIPTVVPDPTPEAGTPVDPIPAELYVRRGSPAASATQPQTARRMQDVARFAFFGNDPAMGNPRVSIERETGAGTWEPLTTAAGNVVDDRLPDIIVTYTPLPLSGSVDEPDPVREHAYLAEWQAVQTWDGLDRAPTLPLGRYRFAVSGQSRDPADTEYPFDGIAWSATSDPFDVVPAELQVEVVDGSDPAAVSLRARYHAPPMGFRLVHRDADRTAPIPLMVGTGGLTADGGGDLPVSGLGTDGSWTTFTVDTTAATGPISIDDGHGNTGVVALGAN
mgnify:CR=1 FL=1